MIIRKHFHWWRFPIDHLWSFLNFLSYGKWVITILALMKKDKLLRFPNEVSSETIKWKKSVGVISLSSIVTSLPWMARCHCHCSFLSCPRDSLPYDSIFLAKFRCSIPKTRQSKYVVLFIIQLLRAFLLDQVRIISISMHHKFSLSSYEHALFLLFV